jgi:hypothetical protein
LTLCQRSPQKNKHEKRAIANFKLGLFLTCDRFVSQSGLTGLGLNLAQEFSFWANAIYHDIKGDA